MRPILLTLTTVFWWYHIARSFDLDFYWYWKNKLYVYQFLEDLFFIFLMFNASCCHSPKVEREIEIKFFTFISNFELSCVVIGFSFWLNSKTQSKAQLSAIIWHTFLQSWQKICLLIASKPCRVAIFFIQQVLFICSRGQGLP